MKLGDTDRTQFWAVGFFALLSTGIACIPAIPYVPQLRGNQPGATVFLRLPIPERKIAGNNRIDLDVYDFRSGCPAICGRSRASGYEGSISLNLDWQPPVNDVDGTPTGEPDPRQPPPDSIVVPGGERIALKGSWHAESVNVQLSCDLTVSFRPENGHKYLFSFRSPSATQRGCSVSLLEIIKEGNEDKLVPVASLGKKDVFGGCDTKALCAPTP